MSEEIYKSAQDAMAEMNPVAINYHKHETQTKLFMWAMISRFAMNMDLKIPVCNPNPITGKVVNLPEHPADVLDRHLYDITRAKDDPSVALGELFSRKNTVGGIIKQHLQTHVKPKPDVEYEDDREPVPMNDADDDADDINFV